MSLSILVLLLCLINFNFSFNIDTNFPIIYVDPLLNKLSYFGYSLVLYPGSSTKAPWILIGAPKAKDRSNKYKSGACYICGIKEQCRFFNVDDFLSSKDYGEKVDNAWIGGSMDISYNSDRVVTCAPRWIKINKGQTDYHMQGACYWFHSGDNSTQKLTPLLEPHRDIYKHPTAGNSVYYFAQGQAGFSVHLPTTKMKGMAQLVLGAPGVYNWDGTSILYKDNKEEPPVASRLQSSARITRAPDVSEFSSKNIGNAIETTATLAYDLLGYSTASGYFYNKAKLLYVSSAPRSDYKGQVLIYDFHKISEKPLQVKEFIFGVQFGEYFGGSVTAGDINGDNLDDLIVGAPYHSTQKYNEGKIYIFLGSTIGRLQTPKRDSIVGQYANGQFGTTLQYLGDVNHDGFGDIAVAAPYEEKSGVVYIFRGTSDGLDTNYCQRIVGSDIDKNVKGFGMSISRAADMDYNGYPDFAIGAYLSGHVILFRSRPVVTIYQKLTSFVEHLEFKTKSFGMSACFWYYLDQEDVNISINRTLIFDQQLGRAYLQSGEHMKVLHLRPNQTFCENFTVAVMASFSNRYDPITVSLSHTFITKDDPKQAVYVDPSPRGTDMFRLRHPVYNKYGSISSSSTTIPFSLGCKSDNICKSSLKVIPRIVDVDETNRFVLGSKDFVSLEIEIENLGEKAYLTQVLVTLPKIVNFRSTPSACTEKNSSSVLCAVANPLESNGTKLVTLELDMTYVNSGKYDESLVFIIEVITSSENDKDKIKELVLELKYEADVMITGTSEAQSYAYRNITNGKLNFTQMYQIETFGSSPLKELFVEILIPYSFKNATSNFTSLHQPFGTLAGRRSVMCTSNFAYITEEKPIVDDLDGSVETGPTAKVRLRRSAEARVTRDNEVEAFQNRTFYINCSMEQVMCLKVACSVGLLRSRQILKINVKMHFDIEVINEMLGKKDIVRFTTQGNVAIVNPKKFVQSGDRPDSVIVDSVFISDLPAEVVALWIIILSVVAGILLLLLLIVGLVKCGFFKRTTKEELQNLKKEMENAGEGENYDGGEEF